MQLLSPPLLRDPDPRLRTVAAAVLAGFGPEAREALPALDAARRDRRRVVRDAVREAREAITGDPGSK